MVFLIMWETTNGIMGKDIAENRNRDYFMEKEHGTKM